MNGEQFGGSREVPMRTGSNHREHSDMRPRLRIPPVTLALIAAHGAKPAAIGEEDNAPRTEERVRRQQTSLGSWAGIPEFAVVSRLRLKHLPIRRWVNNYRNQALLDR